MKRLFSLITNSYFLVTPFLFFLVSAHTPKHTPSNIANSSNSPQMLIYWRPYIPHSWPSCQARRKPHFSLVGAFGCVKRNCQAQWKKSVVMSLDETKMEPLPTAEAPPEIQPPSSTSQSPSPTVPQETVPAQPPAPSGVRIRPKTCDVRNCDSNSLRNPDVLFVCVPSHSYPERRFVWLTLMQAARDKKRSYCCSRHFKASLPYAMYRDSKWLPMHSGLMLWKTNFNDLCWLVFWIFWQPT